MKRIILLSALAAVLAGCSKPETLFSEDSDAKVRISAPLVSTRTWLDSASGLSPLPVFWSDGDMVNVNGNASKPISVPEGTRLASAEFSVRGVEAPYRVVYPHSICEGSIYSDDGTIEIAIPQTQEYSPVSFGNGAALMYGYAEEGAVAMKNLCGAVRVAMTGDSTQVIGKVVLSSNSEDAPIAGRFSLDPRSGVLTPVEGVSSVALDLTGVRLDSQHQAMFYLTIPAGVYPEGFTITFYNEEQRPMACRWLRESAGSEAGVTVKAGFLTDFTDVGYVPGVKDITSVSEWNEFVLAVNSGDEGWKEKYLHKDGVVRLGADIVLDESSSPVNRLDLILDGQGHTITDEDASAPLFTRVTGEIRNLVIAGSMRQNPSPSDKGLVPLVSVLEGGVLKNCTNRMNIDFECAGNVAMAGLVRSIVGGGTISGCRNEASLVLSADCSTALRNVYAGGIVARVYDLTSPVVIEDCTNAGKMEVTVNTASKYGACYAGYGGIVGWLSGGDADNYLSVRRCSNSADISLFCPVDNTAPGHSYNVGGILGLGALTMTGGREIANPLTETHYYAEIEDCTNSGRLVNQTISNSSSASIKTKIFTGGIAGSLLGLKDKHSRIKGCTNTGEIVPHTGKYSRAPFSGLCGGIAGLGGYVDYEDCTVRCNLGTAKAQCYAVAGIAAQVLTTFHIKGCKVSAAISMIQATNYTVGNYGLAVTSNAKLLSGNPNSSEYISLGGSTITGSSFTGSLTLGEAKYQATSMSAGAVTAITPETYAGYIVSPSYAGDEIKLENNTYWNGI